MIKAVYSDDYILVIDKPPGLVVTSAETIKEPTLEDLLKSEYKINIERSGIVHRLDKDTSGLLVVAKNLQVMEKLQAQFKERSTHKEYLALVHGWVEKEGKIDAPIIRNPRDREKFIVVAPLKVSPYEAKGREAVTEYKPLGNFQFSIFNFQKIFEGFNKIQMRKLERAHYGQFTLLRCFPLTGRTHQIRVHLKYLGFPIVGDEKYGGRKTSRLDRRFCPRQFLHAAKLEFTHPVTGERVKFESPLPQELEAALKLLETVN